MDDFNHLNQVPIASLSNDELAKIASLEKELDEKYYIIAFEKE
ncbi:hypothetical protein PV797_10045 [Clostridiaceae bacterium M8S5]|nr:hypothetical protein PV797_10045 [Clostridiaceae bacterium M8S5]